MTSTFNLVIWFLIETHNFIIIIIFAKFFSNPTMHNKVMGQTRTGFTDIYAHSLSVDCDLDLWPSDMVLVHNTSYCPDNQLFLNHFKILPCITKLWVGHKQVSLKSMHNLSGNCGLDLWPSDMVLVRDTASCHDDHLCHITFKSHYA